MNKNEDLNVFETICLVLFYILSIPFIIAFAIIGAVLATAILFIYSIVEIIAWPISEIRASIKLKKKLKEAKTNAYTPEKIEVINLEEVNNE